MHVKNMIIIFTQKSLPMMKTAAPMKIALKTWPEAVAIYFIKNASDPAKSVPNPLLSPLHNVAPTSFNNTLVNYHSPE